MREEQKGKNKLSGNQLFETDHNLDTSDIQFLEDTLNTGEGGESLIQEWVAWSWRVMMMIQTTILLTQRVT